MFNTFMDILSQANDEVIVPKYPKVNVILSSQGLDVVGAVAKVSNAMYHAGASVNDVNTFTHRAMRCNTYNLVVGISREYVQVS